MTEASTNTAAGVTLPWPPKELSPNARSHWATKSKAAKAYRHACWTLAKAAGIIAPETPGRLHLWIDFYPPDRRHRDDDNMIAAFKSGRDGLADALGVNDRRFVCHPYVKDQIGGMIKVRITAGPQE
jgi:crossover junction endodeoxyribonuclease RusA